MSEQKYILTAKVHFGALKTSFSQGTIVIVDKEARTFKINDEQYDGLTDINLCLKSNYLIPYSDGDAIVKSKERISPKVQERLEKGKMEIVKSNMDAMEKQITIKSPKKATQSEESTGRDIPIIKEDASKQSRGLQVVNNDAKRVAMAIRSADTDAEVLAQINGEGSSKQEITITTETKSIGKPRAIEGMEAQEGKVIKKIGAPKSETKSVSGARKLSAKHSDKGSAESAKALAESRKREIASKREKKA